MSKILKSTTLGNVKNGGIFKALGKEFVKLDGRTLEAERSACIYRHDHEGSIPGRNRLADDPVRACVARLPGGWTVGRFL